MTATQPPLTVAWPNEEGILLTGNLVAFGQHESFSFQFDPFQEERIFIELMMSDCQLKASREASE